MRILVYFLLAMFISCFLIACVGHDVAIVNDINPQPVDFFNKRKNRIEQANIQKGDRLVVLRLRYKNPLEFANLIRIRQFPHSKTGNSVAEMLLDDASGNQLTLLRFRDDGGENAYVRPTPCLYYANINCGYSPIAIDETYVKIKLPPPGEVSYAGVFSYEIEDQFPHRGTKNYPLLKKMKLTDEYEIDKKMALKNWPILLHRHLSKNIANIRTGSLDFNNMLAK